MPIQGMTPEEILVETAKQVASGAKSTDRASKLPGETSAEANARLTAGYKEMTAQPILTPEMEDAGYQVKFVRKGAGGVGIYEAVAPIFSPKVEDNQTTQWTMGIIPTIGGKLTGTTLGAWSNGDGTVTNISDIPFTTITSMGAEPVLAATTLDGKPGGVRTSAPVTTAATKYTPEELQRIVSKLSSGGTLTAEERSAVGMGTSTAAQSDVPDDQYYTVKVGTTGKTQAQLDAAKGQETAFQLNKDIAKLLGGTVDPTTGKVTNVAGKTVTSIVPNANGTTTVTASDGTTTIVKTPNTAVVNTDTSGTKVISRTQNNPDGSTTYFYTDGTQTTVGKTGNNNAPGNDILTTGSSTGATAFDVFKNTLALFFGPQEMNKPWVSQIYKTISGYTKSGSTAEEAFNMAVLESENNPALADFTKRFKGIYALQKMKQAGKAVTVPTVAEYFATETKMGDILKASNLGDLANEDFLGDVLGKGVSATEFANRITNIFDRIDIAPDVTKKTIARYFPTLDRTQLARALALGEKGAKQLQQDLAGYEVLSAAEAQGLGVSSTLPGGVTNEQAQQIAKGGGTFASTLGQFGQIAAARETEQKLAEISGMKSLGVAGLTSAVINKSATELKALEDLTRQEEARFSGKAGNIGSKTFASQSRANRVI